LAGGVVGYVLGTRAGRERYAQIKRGAKQVWASEPVQSGVGEAGSMATHAAESAGEKIADVAKSVKDKVAGESADQDESLPPVSPVDPVVAPTGSAPQEGIS